MNRAKFFLLLFLKQRNKNKYVKKNTWIEREKKKIKQRNKKQIHEKGHANRSRIVLSKQRNENRYAFCLSLLEKSDNTGKRLVLITRLNDDNIVADDQW